MAETNPIVVQETLKRLTEVGSSTSAVDIESDRFVEIEELTPSINIIDYSSYSPIADWEAHEHEPEWRGRKLFRYLNAIYSPTAFIYPVGFHHQERVRVPVLKPAFHNVVAITSAQDDHFGLVLDDAVRDRWVQAFLQSFVKINGLEEWSDVYTDDEGAAYLELAEAIDNRISLISRDVSMHLLWHIGEDMGSKEYLLLTDHVGDFANHFVRLIEKFRSRGASNVESENNGS